MKKINLCLAILMSSFMFQAFGQEANWKEQVSKDGKTQMKRRFYEQTDEKGTTFQVVHYIASIQTDVAFEKCLAVIEDPSKHHIFLQNTTQSKKIKTVSENEFLIYYFYKAPWPLPDSDCVTLMKKTIRNEGKEIEFRGIASPKLHDDKGVRRFELNDIVYTIKKLDNDLVELTVESKFIPVVSAPNWMVDTWFPEGPSGLFERLINLAKK